MRTANKRILGGTYLALLSMLLAMATLVISSRDSKADRSMYLGTENHVVPLNNAREWTAIHQRSAMSTDLIAGYFGRSIFDRILSENKCVGIRIYNAKHTNGDPVFVLVGVDKDGKDIAEGTIGEGVTPCPPYCPDNSPLIVLTAQQLSYAQGKN